LQQASTLEDVQKKFGVGRASLGSLSESVSIIVSGAVLVDWATFIDALAEEKGQEQMAPLLSRAIRFPPGLYRWDHH
jgi:hypothetical protein